MCDSMAHLMSLSLDVLSHCFYAPLLTFDVGVKRKERHKEVLLEVTRERFD